jgi:hypothetical protein
MAYAMQARRTEDTMRATELLNEQLPTDAATRGEYPLASQRAGQGGWGRLITDRDYVGSEFGAGGTRTKQESDSNR